MSRSRNEPSAATWQAFEEEAIAQPTWDAVWHFAIGGPRSVAAGGAFHTNLCLFLRFGTAPDDAEAREHALYRSLTRRLGTAPWAHVSV